MAVGDAVIRFDAGVEFAYVASLVRAEPRRWFSLARHNTAVWSVPFRFTGKLDELTIELRGPPLSEELQRQKEKQLQKNDAAQ